MKTYTGDRTIDGVEVTVNGHPLDPRTDLHAYTASGFEWTYVGAGPQQLALALLADHLDDDESAVDLSERFMNEIVANFANEWVLTSEDIEEALQTIR